MLDYRSPLMLASAPAGLALAGALWLTLGVHSSALSRLDALQIRLTAARPPAQSLDGADELVRAASVPLFSLTTGPGSVADAQIRLDGLAITPHSKSALISIGGKPSEWIDLGATQDGVTLIDVQPSKVTLDTATGFKEASIAQGGPEEPRPPPSSQRQQPTSLPATESGAPPPGTQNAGGRTPGVRPFGPPRLMAPNAAAQAGNPGAGFLTGPPPASPPTP